MKNVDPASCTSLRISMRNLVRFDDFVKHCHQLYLHFDCWFHQKGNGVFYVLAPLLNPCYWLISLGLKCLALLKQNPSFIFRNIVPHKEFISLVYVNDNLILSVSCLHLSIFILKPCQTIDHRTKYKRYTVYMCFNFLAWLPVSSYLSSRNIFTVSARFNQDRENLVWVLISLIFGQLWCSVYSLQNEGYTNEWHSRFIIMCYI